MHEAFFFGSIERQLFASYHPPANAGGQTLTILCAPIFAEYNRTHAIFRKLSVSLASHGHHVIRFDYSGTGDSFGSLESSTVNDWTNDIQRVIQEGIDLTGCSRVRLLGVRIGALLACTSVNKVKEVDRLVLWDPVCDGSEYFRSLQMRLESTLSHNQFVSRGDRLKAKRNYSGYNLSEKMVDGIRSMDTSAYTGISSDKLRVVRTVSSREFPLRDVLEEVIPANCQWDSEDEEVIMSQPILESLASRLVEA